ncbi:MAG: phosphoribosyltransferase [Euryarchaeota archaeon]|nr:phosphoribosyltransferase [Euryarchaeota archaeon]MDE1835370.1 phosphoribosyltransferase [Euryarchaeota archaeon]MDE1880473.1 phosphoribosyltransferase [Euryarchaeota archaeon]MDE2043666.1 phosphoribosyltransferase [Thermoplasmata archaeon]
MSTRSLAHTPAFADRYEAGRLLAYQMRHLSDEAPIVLALPRGGVPLGYEVARGLTAPLDLLLVRKIPAPGRPELTVGVVGEGGAVRIDEAVVREHHIRWGDLDEVILHEQEEIERQAWKYYRGRPRIGVKDRVVVLVDDGVGTGRTATFAIEGLRRDSPKKVVLGVGVVAPEAYPGLLRITDGVYSPLVPGLFHSIGEWYREFEPIGELEIERLLQEIHHLHDADALPVPQRARVA